MTLTETAPRIRTANDHLVVEPASWWARAGALGLDVLPGAAVLATAALVALSVPLHGGWWWVSVGIAAAAVLWTGFNGLILPGASGRSLGRRAFGIALLRRPGSAATPWTLLHTEAHVVDAPTVASSRRNAACVVLVAAALCVAGATVSVATVRQQDRASSKANAEIAAQGPRMVEQILSYRPETIQGDFDRARSFASDAYRGQLITQQQAVVKAGPVRNEYWVTNGSVLSATPGRATMLLFLQGQRGAAPDQRYLTASVRVNFVESDSAPWRVDGLTVVTNPPSVTVKP